MSSFVEVSYYSLIIIPVSMRETPLQVESYGICLRNVGTYVY